MDLSFYFYENVHWHFKGCVIVTDAVHWLTVLIWLFQVVCCMLSLPEEYWKHLLQKETDFSTTDNANNNTNNNANSGGHGRHIVVRSRMAMFESVSRDLWPLCYEWLKVKALLLFSVNKGEHGNLVQISCNNLSDTRQSLFYFTNAIQTCLALAVEQPAGFSRTLQTTGV